MSEHIQIEAVGLPMDTIQELEAPCLAEDERPFYQHMQKTWTGKSTVLNFYKSGLIKASSSGRRSTPVLIRPGILNPEPVTQFHVPHLFTLLSVGAVITSGVLYYLSIFNEWMFAFCLILALALIISQTTYRVTFNTVGGHCSLFCLQSWFIHRKQIAKVANLIKKMSAECELGKASLPQLIQEHRRLLNEGMIPEQEYEAAKSRIFSRRQ